MFCKKCGSALPSSGYICKECGMMMDEEQIKMQNELIKENQKNARPVFMSEKYGRKKGIVYNYEKDSSLVKALIFIVLVFLAILSIIIFLVKR